MEPIEEKSESVSEGLQFLLNKFRAKFSTLKEPN